MGSTLKQRAVSRNVIDLMDGLRASLKTSEIAPRTAKPTKVVKKTSKPKSKAS
jgi:non-homologous end joining protein Ku